MSPTGTNDPGTNESGARAVTNAVSRRHVLQLFDHLKIDTVLDVGANHGQFASSLRDNGYDGWIYSFEPVKSVFDSLTARMSSTQKWKGFNVALGDADDRKTINVAAGDAQASSFLSFNEDGPARWGDSRSGSGCSRPLRTGSEG